MRTRPTPRSSRCHVPRVRQRRERRRGLDLVNKVFQVEHVASRQPIGRPCGLHVGPGGQRRVFPEHRREQPGSYAQYLDAQRMRRLLTKAVRRIGSANDIRQCSAAGNEHMARVNLAFQPADELRCQERPVEQAASDLDHAERRPFSGNAEIIGLEASRASTASACAGPQRESVSPSFSVSETSAPEWAASPGRFPPEIRHDRTG